MEGSRYVKLPHEKGIGKTSAKPHEERPPPNTARAPLNTAVNDAVSERKKGKERIPPKETDDHRVLFNKYSKNQVPLNQNKTQDNEEDRIPPSINKTVNNRNSSQEKYVEVFTFDDTDEITLCNKRNS